MKGNTCVKIRINIVDYPSPHEFFSIMMDCWNKNITPSDVGFHVYREIDKKTVF